MLFLYAGILYLIAMAVVLVLKPAFMFRPNGTWKEFGIGRNPSTHTWLPFWLFAILWSLISYILVTMAFAVYGHAPVQDTDATEISIPIPKKTRSKGKPLNIPNGYYMLNNDATEAAGGVPKYVYIGQGLPDDS